MDIVGLGALALVTAEWLALGTLSGIAWPPAHDLFWATRWALRLLVGAIVIAITQVVLALFGLGFANIPVVLAAAAILAVAIRLLTRRTRCADGPKGSAGQSAIADAADGPASGPWPAPMDTRERASWLLLGAILLAATARSLLVPEAGWDAFSHWGLRAQAFALAGTLVDAHSEHEYYPPLVPLLEAWLYLHRGAVWIDLGKTVWAVLGSAFAVCLSWHLRLSLRPTWLAPLVATLIVVSTPELLEHFWTGQADLALTAFLTLATLALFQAQRSRNTAWLNQAAVFAAAAALTKFEGVPRLAVVLGVLALDYLLGQRLHGTPQGKGRLRLAFLGALAVVVPAACASLLWLAFELTRGIAANAEHLGQLQPLALGAVLVSLWGVFAGVRTGGGVLVAVLAWIVTGRHLFSSPIRLLTLVVLGQLAATLLAFLLSDTSPDVAVRTSATRLFEQFLPLAFVAAALALARALTCLQPVPPARDL